MPTIGFLVLIIIIFKNNLQLWKKEYSIKFKIFRKYIAEHYPELDIEGIPFRKAIEGGETRGQLKRISGKYKGRRDKGSTQAYLR